MGYPTKRMKELRIKRNVRNLTKKAANGDASAMEALGINFVRRVADENDSINCFDGLLSALYWFDKAVAAGKEDTNYWIGETIDLDLYCRGSSGAYYHHGFLEYLSKNSENPMLKEVMAAKTGYLYKVLNDKGIFPFDNESFYLKAANCGDSSASYRLGEIYLMKWLSDYKNYMIDPKEEIPPHNEDLMKARKYLEYASKNGEDEAFPIIFDVMKDLGKAIKQK